MVPQYRQNKIDVRVSYEPCIYVKSGANRGLGWTNWMDWDQKGPGAERINLAIGGNMGLVGPYYSKGGPS